MRVYVRMISIILLNIFMKYISPEISFLYTYTFYTYIYQNKTRPNNFSLITPPNVIEIVYIFYE
jgi:hypothetical protein